VFLGPKTVEPRSLETPEARGPRCTADWL
jgi:hypothetical protein